MEAPLLSTYSNSHLTNINNRLEMLKLSKLSSHHLNQRTVSSILMNFCMLKLKVTSIEKKMQKLAKLQGLGLLI